MLSGEFWPVAPIYFSLKPLKKKQGENPALLGSVLVPRVVSMRLTKLTPVK